MQNLKGIDTRKIQSVLHYIQPAFAHIDNEANINELKSIRSNTLCKEYTLALKIANLILRQYSYDISTIGTSVVKTPPFRIGMSKLFELYVFAKLKERFNQHNEVTYRKTFNRLEQYSICNTKDDSTIMIMGAKYKPQYKNSNLRKKDIRQISGYVRLNKI